MSTTACNANDLKSYARDIAKSNSDPLFKILGDLGTAAKSGPVTVATDKAYDALARLAAIRGTADQKSAVAGAVFNSLVHGIFGCADPAIALGAVEQNFGAALGAGWVFEVRGKSTDPQGGAYERGSTTANWWAAEAPGGWASAITTSTLTDHRVLIYGFETSSFLNVGGRFGGSSFEHRTIPKIAAGVFALTVNIGLCVADGSTITSSQRLNHNNTFIPLISNLSCATPTGFTPTSGSLALGRMSPIRLAHRAFGFFAPQSAYAAFAVGSVGGAVSELSPSAVYNLSNTRLSELGTVADGKNSVALATTTGAAVSIRVKDADGSPLQGVPVEMSIAGNSSTIAFFSENGAPAVATVTRVTDSSGYASFADVAVTKAGGYILNFRVSFNGVVGAPTASNSFNIQNK